MENAIEEKTVGDCIVKIFYDEDPIDWRKEGDNLGNMICFHGGYNLGDDHKYDVDELNEIVNQKDVIALPLYLYDHSGITMSTGSFGCRWDSGQVGYIFVDYAQIRKEYGWKNVTAKRREKIISYLEGEVKSYDNYLTGQIFGYVAENKDGDHIGSCWGFNDIEECMNEGIAEIEWEKKDNIKTHIEKVKVWIKNNVPVIYRTECPVQT